MNFILEQLSELEEISYRAMMGEFILYYRGKIIGGIYDDQLLVDNAENKAFLSDLVRAIHAELPNPEQKISRK